MVSGGVFLLTGILDTLAGSTILGVFLLVVGASVVAFGFGKQRSARRIAKQP